ncbi:MAG: DUF3352 domain-containing protein [Myxococcota bacterium]
MTITDLPAAASAMKTFFDTATKDGAAMAASVDSATKQQAGFDVFDPKAYSEVGIDPAGGLTFFAEGDSKAGLLAIRTSDEKKATEWLVSLLKRVQGTSEVRDTEFEGAKFRTVGRPFGTEFVPVTHFSFVDENLLIAQEPGKGALVSALKRLRGQGPKANLSQDETYLSLAKKVPKDSTLALFIRGDVLKGTAAEGISKGAFFTATFSGAGFSADAFVDADTGELQKAFSGPAPKPLAKLVGEDAVLVMLTQSATADALPALRKDPTVARTLDTVFRVFQERAGLDAEKDLLPLLAGPLTTGVYLEDPQRALAMVQLQGANPNALLDAVHASVTAEVKDSKKMVELLDSAMSRLEYASLKFKKTESERNGKPLVRYEPDRPQPKLAWALYGNTYVYGAGTGRLDTMLDIIDGERPSISLDASAGGELVAKKGAAVIVIRLGALGDKVGDMAASLGGGGAAMFGQFVTSAVSMAKTVGDVAMAAEVDGEGIRLSVREKLGQ